MSRTARKKAESRIYHVILRGINRQKIFRTDADYQKFLYLLKRTKEITKFELYAYCLMPNHIHLLMMEGEKPLEEVFKRLGCAFVYWYNMKYERVGHLFQDRFKSEPVEDDSYLLTVHRYIHQNPVKAGLCESVEQYPYSSFRGYLKPDGLTDSGLLLGMMSLDEFVVYNNENNDDECMETNDSPIQRINDEKLQERLQKKHHCGGPSEFMLLPEKKKDAVLKDLLHQGGSIRQINRMTGANIWQIRRLRTENIHAK